VRGEGGRAYFLSREQLSLIRSHKLRTERFPFPSPASECGRVSISDKDHGRHKGRHIVVVISRRVRRDFIYMQRGAAHVAEGENGRGARLPSPHSVVHGVKKEVVVAPALILSGAGASRFINFLHRKYGAELHSASPEQDEVMLITDREGAKTRSLG